VKKLFILLNNNIHKNISKSIYIRMTDINNIDSITWLSGALIVLSLLLLYCWYVKSRRQGFKKKRQGFIGYLDGDDMSGGFRQTDGFSPKLRHEYLPGLKLRNDSLHETENHLVNRHQPSKKEKASDVMLSRWKAEGFNVSSWDDAISGYPTVSQSDYNITNRAQEVIKDEILTPLKSKLDSSCLNTGSMQLLNMELDPQYKPEYGQSRSYDTVSI
jgi:hypothetical protein